MPVQVLARPVVTHRRARVGVPSSDLDITRIDPASSIVVTNVCRSRSGRPESGMDDLLRSQQELDQAELRADVERVEGVYPRKVSDGTFDDFGHD
jgi:hypothetical protein